MDNPDAVKETRTQRPTSENEDGRFKDRLKEAIGSRSMRDFALKSGVSPSVLRSYLRGDSEPGREALVAMAREAGYSVGWLATGEGPKSSDEIGEQRVAYGDSSGAIDWELMETVIAALDIIITRRGLAVSAKWKAMMQRKIYRYYKEQGSHEEGLSAADRATLMDIIDTALTAGALTDGESEH